MRSRFVTQFLSTLAVVISVSNPSITNERYCISNILKSEDQLVLRINIPLHHFYRKLQH